MSCKVFVGNVPFDCTNENFINVFKNLKGYLNAEIISRNNQISTTRGFGFITFSSEKFANDFLDEIKNITYTINDRTLRFTKYFNTNNNFIFKNLKKNNIFVSNLPDSLVKDEDLINLFKKNFNNAEIVIGYINKDIITNKNINTGYIEFKNEKDYNDAIKKKFIELNNHKIFISKFSKNNKPVFSYNMCEIYKVAFNEKANKNNLQKC